MELHSTPVVVARSNEIERGLIEGEKMNEDEMNSLETNAIVLVEWLTSDFPRKRLLLFVVITLQAEHFSPIAENPVKSLARHPCQKSGNFR